MINLTEYIILLEEYSAIKGKQISLKKENKKAAIVSFGGTSLSSDNVRSVDLIYSREMLENEYGRHVDFVSHIVKGDIDNEYCKDITETKLKDYDEVWVYMAPENAFGGILSADGIELFNQICDYNGTLYGIVADPKILPTNYGEFLNNRVKRGVLHTDKGNNRDVTDAKFKRFTKKWDNIIIAFGGINYDKFFNEYEEKKDKGTPSHNFKLPIANNTFKWCEFPVFTYYAKKEKYEEKIKDYPYNRKYDLVYFGNNRGGSRDNKLEKYYDVKGLNNYIIGFNYDGFKYCRHTSNGKYVNHDELFKLICENAYATVVIGDELHDNNFMTVRFFEAMLLDIVGFISDEYDTEHKLIKNKELADFIYVKNSDEVKEKIEKIKKNKSLFDKIIKQERAEVNRIYNEYFK